MKNGMKALLGAALLSVTMIGCESTQNRDMCSDKVACCGSCSGESKGDCCGTCKGESKGECCGSCGGEAKEACCGTCGGGDHSHSHGDGHSHD
ncbi:MAG: hypothetical protein JJ974_06890 [Phycisphaerales bacterium]|nr:hypothetical protein [Phycisphaerales bacterium]